MKTAQFKLNSSAMIALAISTAFPIAAEAAAGRVEFAIGGVTAITPSGESRVLSKGVEINSGDTIRTTDGRVQVRFTDGGYMSLQPNTEFIVENYQFEGKQDGSERGFFRLVEGGLRAITGIVGRNNRPAYRVATPVATIGIRGSEFLAEHRDNRLRTRVIGGSIYIENEFGDLILFKGQSAETQEGESPQYSEEESGVQAKGPEGGGPQQGEEESQQDRETNNLFAVNDIRDAEGNPCAISNSCEQLLSGGDELSAVIAQYAAQNAVGSYSLNTSQSSIAGLNNGQFDYGWLDVYFGDYSVSTSFTISAENTFSSGVYGSESFYGSGSLTGSGGLSISGASSGYGDLCSGGCTFNGIGALSGAMAETATINYSITGIDTGYGSSTASANAVYDADYIGPYSSEPSLSDGF